MRGSPLYWESAGAGEPLVLLHAGVADLRMWDEQVEAFAAGYRVIRFDAQGFGRSPVAAEPATRAEDLYELLRTLGVRQAHVVGLSFGGASAIDFALTYPAMVGALIAVAPGLSGYKPSDPSLVVWIDELEQRETACLERGDVEAATELSLQAWLAGPRRAVSEMDSALVELLRPMARFALERQTQRGRAPQIEPPAAARLGEITAPTLLIVGDYDVPLVLEVVDILADRIPGAKKQVFARTAHMVNLERPAEFNESVLEFLAVHPLG